LTVRTKAYGQQIYLPKQVKDPNTQETPEKDPELVNSQVPPEYPGPVLLTVRAEANGQQMSLPKQEKGQSTQETPESPKLECRAPRPLP